MGTPAWPYSERVDLARRRKRKPYIRRTLRAVLSLVPRRSKFITPLAELYGRIGNGAFERSRTVFDQHGRATARRHIGWRWPCDCLAFARPEGDYLWVPCNRHDGGVAGPRSTG
jgi:hypothetical protein